MLWNELCCLANLNKDNIIDFFKKEIREHRIPREDIIKIGGDDFISFLKGKAIMSHALSAQLAVYFDTPRDLFFNICHTDDR